jgi:apolipoprotein D and lipocalin family protein
MRPCKAGLLPMLWLCGCALAANSDEVNRMGVPADSAAGPAPVNGSPPGRLRADAPQQGQPAPVPVFDLDRFAGRWHVLAVIPDRFHKSCIAGATAAYTLQPGRRLRVEHRCRARDDSLQLDQGVLRLEPPGSPEGRLEARYAPDWLTWLPLAWSDVWVVALDADYRQAALATPDGDFLWVLARHPRPEAQAWGDLLAKLEAEGFDMARLKRLPPEPETTAPAEVAPGQ